MDFFKLYFFTSSFLINRVTFAHLRFSFDLRKPMELLQNTTESLEKLYAEDMAKASFKAKKIETEDDVLSVWKDQSFSDLYSTRLMEGAAVSLILLECSFV